MFRKTFVLCIFATGRRAALVDDTRAMRPWCAVRFIYFHQAFLGKDAINMEPIHPSQAVETETRAASTPSPTIAEDANRRYRILANNIVELSTVGKEVDTPQTRVYDARRAAISDLIRERQVDAIDDGAAAPNESGSAGQGGSSSAASSGNDATALKSPEFTSFETAPSKEWNLNESFARLNDLRRLTPQYSRALRTTVRGLSTDLNGLTPAEVGTLLAPGIGKIVTENIVETFERDIKNIHDRYLKSEAPQAAEERGSSESLERLAESQDARPTVAEIARNIKLNGKIGREELTKLEPIIVRKLRKVIADACGKTPGEDMPFAVLPALPASTALPSLPTASQTGLACAKVWAATSTGISAAVEGILTGDAVKSATMGWVALALMRQLRARMTLEMGGTPQLGPVRK